MTAFYKLPADQVPAWIIICFLSQSSLPTFAQDQEIQGYVFMRDALGKSVRRKIEDVLPSLRKAEAKKKKSTGISESWVEEF